jgi:hypothetical protein
MVIHKVIEALAQELVQCGSKSASQKFAPLALRESLQNNVREAIGSTIHGTVRFTAFSVAAHVEVAQDGVASDVRYSVPCRRFAREGRCLVLYAPRSPWREAWEPDRDSRRSVPQLWEDDTLEYRQSIYYGKWLRKWTMSRMCLSWDEEIGFVSLLANR